MPQYRLQTLLEIRERAEEEAKQAFSEAMKALAKEKATLLELEQDLERRKAARKQKVQEFLAEVMKKGVGASGMGQMNRFEDRLKDEEKQVALEIERQKETVRQAEALVEQRRVEMAEAAKEKKAIEKHKDNWKTEVRKERMAREELAQEEIGNTLHLQRTRAAQKTDNEK
ncbi:MAG: YscO family type III secretion system apparatus protein [Archangiaceae bacterium]|nr:YscO family type III secretion system apparatus protein [Archangiaceae bacterium]